MSANFNFQMIWMRMWIPVYWPLRPWSHCPNRLASTGIGCRGHSAGQLSWLGCRGHSVGQLSWLGWCDHFENSTQQKSHHFAVSCDFCTVKLSWVGWVFRAMTSPDPSLSTWLSGLMRFLSHSACWAWLTDDSKGSDRHTHTVTITVTTHHPYIQTIHIHVTNLLT